MFQTTNQNFNLNDEFKRWKALVLLLLHHFLLSKELELNLPGGLDLSSCENLGWVRDRLGMGVDHVPNDGTSEASSPQSLANLKNPNTSELFSFSQGDFPETFLQIS